MPLIALLATLVFQPGFHQALRTSVSTSTRTTYRLKVPIGRAGARLRLSFKAGDGSLTLHSATVASAGMQGTLASAPVAVTFGGSSGFSAAARQRVTSDPIAFTAAFGAELYVSFDVDGSLAASTINAFPDSYTYAGSVAATSSPAGGTTAMRAVGLDTIDIEGEQAPAFVALGDSITEGYVSGDVGDFVSRHDDYRQAWTTVAQGLLRLPVANAAVSGQGVDDAIAGLGSEVFPLQGITDCLVLIGTNDLGGKTEAEIDSRLTTLFDQLRPFCRIWAGILLPKERTTNGVYATVVSRRHAVNDFLRHTARIDGIIDFEPALAAPGDIDHFGAGFGEDGIHPSIAGQDVMGRVAAKVLTPPVNIAPPDTTPTPTPAPVPPQPDPVPASASPPAVAAPAAGGCNGTGVGTSALLLLPLLAFFSRRKRR